ncbi:MAG: hypothetical protein HY005_01955 [Candidatus Staskawiczbacteria bacterium]|nr:hypothetical protein [Candidatus Staskawiczbacteria bacterium]
MAYYIVHKSKIKENINKLKNAFLKKGLNFQLFYSVKTNFMEPVLETIKQTDSQFEIVSSYEWELIKKVKPKELVLNGPGKSVETIKDILNSVEILYFNIDNDTDFDILQILKKEGLLSKIRVGLRLYFDKPGIWNRFGYSISDEKLSKKLNLLITTLKLDGLHFHFSTNNFNLSNYEFLLKNIKNTFDKIKHKITFVNIGGGLPAANEFIFGKDIYKKIPSLIKNIFPKIKIMSEAGRNIVSDAIYIETSIISIRKNADNYFDVVVDTNIMHFQCYFEKKFWIEFMPKRKDKKEEIIKVNIFGNSCMQIDKIAENLIINQIPVVGDKIIIHNIGAYSFSQASNFISPIPLIKIYE